MKRLILVGLFSLAFLSPAFSQVSADVQQGLIPFGAYQHGDIDSVNLSNGNVTIHIPVVSYPQRGGKLNLSFSLIANGKGWFIYKSGTNYLWRFQNNPGLPVASVPPWMVALSGPEQAIGRYENILRVKDYNGDQYLLHIWNLTTADGATHEIAPTNSAGGLVVYQGETIDGSGLYLDQTTNTVIDSNGIRSVAVPTAVPSLTDSNGNQITYATNGWTDTLGRVIPPTAGTSTTVTNCPTGTVSATQWNVPAFNGGTASFKLCYANVSIQTNFNEPPVIESSGTSTLLNAVVLPNLQKWQFSYDSYGNVTSIIFPTGGSINYVWANEVIFNAGSRGVVSRTLNANDGTGSHTTNYQYKVLINGQYKNIVTDPAGNDTVNLPCMGSSYICQSQYYSGSRSGGTLLKTVTNAYHFDDEPYDRYTQSLADANVFLQSQTTAWPGGKTSQTTTVPDAGYTYQIWDSSTDGTYSGTGYYGKPVLQTFSDYGQGAAGSIIRQSSTAYLWQSDSNYLAGNLLNLVSSSKQLNGSGNTCAETDYTYDNASYLTGAGVTEQHVAAPGARRGNLSSVTQQLTSTPCQAGASWRPITSFVNAYDTGSTYQATDPLGHITTYSYSPTFYGAYPTQTQLNNTTTPGVSGSVTHISAANYDFNTGLKISATDENSRTTSFTYDNTSRLTQSSFPDGGALTFSYQDTSPFGVTVTRKISSTQNQVSKGIVDGVGRISQTQLTDPNCTVGSGQVKMDFSYTEDTTLHDRLTKTSTPYCDTPGTIYGLMTVNHSDTIGRVKSSVETDSSTVTSAYNDNQTTVTDEAGKQRKSQVDGLGRLTTVWEDPSGLNYETDYTYDPLGNLLTVNQKGTAPGDSTKWRTRTFTYDSLSRLLTAYNPESGTTSYTYNDDGTVATKTTPKQNQTTPSVTVTTTFAYDEIHRLSSKAYSDGTTPAVKYIYDGVSLAGCTPTGLTDSNPKPNRTSMCDAGGSSAWNHDVMGRILSDQRTNSGVTKTTSHTYNLNGSLATLTYPSGRVITYSYNTAARPTSAVDVANSITFATVATYAPQGALASLQNGTSLVSTMYFNNRLQPCRISVKNSGTAPASCTDTAIGNVFDISYNFNLGTSDNGNVIGITNNLNSSRTQSFTYDQVNRITSAGTLSTTGAYCWGYQFSYDSWGNLTSQAGWTPNYTGCTQTVMAAVTADVNNHISAFSYDASGNATGETGFSYNWDAESQLKSASGVNYAYDGDGRRVAKVGSKLYWYDSGGEILAETDVSGNIQNEYIFFGGKRIALIPVGSTPQYYVEDLLGTSRVITTSVGAVCYDADFYPYGGERVPYTNTCTQNNYKFEGKERDTETGNDDFGARYYSNRFGRWLSADWSAVPEPVPYANLSNPQTLNLYAMVSDDPESFADLDGHDGWDFLAQTIGGIENAINENNGINTGSYQPSENQLGRAIGNAISVVQGGVEVLGGAAAVVAGGTEALAASPTVVGSAPGVALAGVGVVGVVHGSTVLKNALSNTSSTAENSSSGKPYESTPENQDRMQQGKAPVGKDGKPVELHHEGQQANGQTREMTQTEHRGGENFKKNHPNTGQQPSQINRNQANQARRKHWKQKASEQPQ